MRLKGGSGAREKGRRHVVSSFGDGSMFAPREQVCFGRRRRAELADSTTGAWNVGRWSREWEILGKLPLEIAEVQRRVDGAVWGLWTLERKRQGFRCEEAALGSPATSWVLVSSFDTTTTGQVTGSSTVRWVPTSQLWRLENECCWYRFLSRLETKERRLSRRQP